jgi:predicted nucleic acid-binding protein
LILVDTSVWVDHFRAGDLQLAALLDNAGVLMHPFVAGEIACGNLSNRALTLELLHDLPMAVVAESDEVLAFIESRRIFGTGIGYIDVHLLAAAAVSDAALWTRDKRLRGIARTLGLAWQDAH